MSDRPRVLVIGAGPAGLAAAAALLERGGVAVELIHMGHHLGGKAASWTGPEGHLVEHGWHMVLGFYERLRALARRAGVDPEAAFLSMQGKSHLYNPNNRGLSEVISQGPAWRFFEHYAFWDAFRPPERRNLNRFMAQTYAEALVPGADLTRHDDICFRTFAYQRGLRPHVTEHPLFRFFREAYFNYPQSVSAYHILQTFRFMSSREAAEQFVLPGGYSEVLWEPIGRYIERLGGRITPYTMVTDLRWQGRRITGLRLARPDERVHAHGRRPWPRTVPEAPGSARIETGFDQVVLAIPKDNVVQLNRDNRRMWRSPYFERLSRLRSAATLALTVITERPVGERIGPVFGLPPPLGICTNMKPFWARYRDDPGVGAVLVFVGQEAGFEDWPDEAIVARTLDGFSAVRGFGDIRAAGIIHQAFHRNTSAHERIMLCEPGVQPFRPAGPRTPFHNLFVAGDWVSNPVDLICMEGAVAAGQQAADAVIEGLGHGDA